MEVPVRYRYCSLTPDSDFELDSIVINNRMDANVAYLGKILHAYFDPATLSEAKMELEAILSQFKASEDSWRLAMHVLQMESRGTPHETYLLWFSASLLQDSIDKGWSAIPDEVREPY
jgi:hypothetical protein